MAMALERHGSLKWNELIEPARKLAANGFSITLKTAQRMKKYEKQLTSFSETSKIFLRNGKPLNENDFLVQPDLAATLKRLQEKGPREFYEGQTAHLIVQEMKKNGGLITAEDLRDYKPVIRKPLTGSYKGYTLLTAPPPSSGGIALLQILKMLETQDLKPSGFQSSDEIHFLVEAMKRAFADRARYSGDPEFTKLPVDLLLSPDHIKELSSSIRKDRATPSKEDFGSRSHFKTFGKYDSYIDHRSIRKYRCVHNNTQRIIWFWSHCSRRRLLAQQ